VEVMAENEIEYRRGFVLGILAFFVASILFLILVVGVVHADITFYGLPNYSAVVLPNNSYVHQGENISQGNYYDLSGVYGFSGVIAHWNTIGDEGYKKPDQIITLDHSLRNMYIDPAKFPVGTYWQLDDLDCDTSGICSGFQHGNPYVFSVVAPMISIQERTIVRTADITVYQNGTEIKIPVTYTQVQTYYGTPTPTQAPGISGTIEVTTEPTIDPATLGPVNANVQDQNGNPIVGGVAGAVPVTVKSPVGITTMMVALVGGAFVILIRRRDK
jgi:hypothetical protein